MLNSTALVLFESTDAPAVLNDPANEDWIAVVKAIDGAQHAVLARRYYEALYHFRQQRSRPALPGRTEVTAPSKAKAMQGMLKVMTERRASKKKESGAHKTSVAAFGNSEIPIDVRVTNYAAEHDGNTLVPHLELLERDLPKTIVGLRHVLADDAYQGKHDAVARFGQEARLTVPVHPSGKSKAQVAAALDGINRFTPIGVPVCEAGHRFEMRGRDISSERYIWVAPDDEEGNSVCARCPFVDICLKKGTRRHIRVERNDFPQIDWKHPQHLARNGIRYQRRTGVERAIKRLKVDLNAEHLTHRDAHRVQAHLDRKRLTLHLLLQAATSG